MYTKERGAWGFAQWRTDCIAVEMDPDVDPLQWKQNVVHILPEIFGPDAPWVLGSAITDGSENDGFIYLMGYDLLQNALLFRIDHSSFDQQQWSALQVRVSPSLGTWASVVTNPHAAFVQATRLFEHAPTETTLLWHPYMKLYYVVLANTHATQSKSLQLRTSKHIDGPWSAPTDLYAFPELEEPGNNNTKDVYCYSAKSHPEFQTKDGRDIVLSYMCNAEWEHVQSAGGNTEANATGRQRSEREVRLFSYWLIHVACALVVSLFVQA
jgi:hypothetical protein